MPQGRAKHTGAATHCKLTLQTTFAKMVSGQPRLTEMGRLVSMLVPVRPTASSCNATEVNCGDAGRSGGVAGGLTHGCVPPRDALSASVARRRTPRHSPVQPCAAVRETPHSRTAEGPPSRPSIGATGHLAACWPLALLGSCRRQLKSCAVAPSPPPPCRRSLQQAGRRSRSRSIERRRR
jgi:hypothetical protein